MAPFRSKKTASTTKDKPAIIRKLGHAETFQSAQHLLDMYYGCAISCRYMVPETLAASASSVETIVERAFARAILEHPLFTVGRINNDSKKPSWIQLARIDLHNHIEWRTVTEPENYENVLHEVLEWQVNHPFTDLETQPNWRSVILRPGNSAFVDVVFAWDHTAGDGKSGKVFHDSLLSCLNPQVGGKDTGPILKDRSFEVPVTALTPPVHKVLKFPISWDFLLNEVRNTAPVQKTPCTTRLASITVEKDALPPVLEACRQHKTTLTGLVHALALVSLASRLPETKARAFQSGTPVCVRRFDGSRKPKHSDLDLEHTVTNSVTYWPYKYDEDLVARIRQQASDAKARPESNADLEATVWSVAMAVRQELSKKLELGTKNDIMGLMKFVGDWRSYVKDREKNSERTFSWELSNLGVINGEVMMDKEGSDEAEKWTIERATFTQSASVSGPALCVSQLAVKGGALVMSCCWQIEVIDEELAKGFSSDLEIWLTQLGRTGGTSFN
ncbi:hypothetical protein ACJZ2D_016154 [Fusarium nematophilum]